LDCSPGFSFSAIPFEIPSNLLLHKIGARIWIARILIPGGLWPLLTGFVHTVRQLYVARFLLGLAEAGYFPGNYPVPDVLVSAARTSAGRLRCFLTGMPVTSILGAPISGLILDHAPLAGYQQLAVAPDT